jgi:hypothetical protein
VNPPRLGRSIETSPITGWVGHHSGRSRTRCLQSRALHPAHFRRAAKALPSGRGHRTAL